MGTYIGSFRFPSCSPPGPPGQASAPSPANEATDVSVDAQLTWTAGLDADSHDVYFGTNPTPDAGELQGNQTATSFDPVILAEGTTYYWRIDEVNGEGTTAGQVWNFTTAAADEITILDATYKADRDELKVRATSSAQPDAVLTVVGYGQMTFKKGKYELKLRAPVPIPQDVIVESSFGGSATAPVEGAPAPPDPTPPDAATNPSAATGVMDVALNASLSWTAGARADSHDVYFGESPTPDAGEFQGNQTATSFDPGILPEGTTYYWRIDEVNEFGTTTGTVWSFTTGTTTATDDDVTITKAEWNQTRNELKVEATSSDQPNVELTVVGFGRMNFKKGKYALKVKPVSNPGTVTVSSSGGGSATRAVTVIVR